MITYPSTHGVYEHDVADICAAVHDVGGQVYVDGANLNALVGLARPGQVRRRRQPPEPAQDVLHPARRRRSRRRPGRGARAPGAVSAGSSAGRRARRRHTVSAAPYGSASILPITWAYIRMMGAEGLRAATLTAIASANYIARRLDEYYPVLYTGENGMVAHECILDLRGITKSDRRHRRRRGEAAGGLRFPRADDELPGGGHADGRADREREPRRGGRVLRRDDRDPRRDRPGRLRAHGPRTTTRCAVRRTPRRACSSTTGSTPTAANRPRIRWVRPSGPRCGRRCGASTARTVTATWCVRARRWRRSPDVPYRSRSGVARHRLLDFGGRGFGGSTCAPATGPEDQFRRRDLCRGNRHRAGCLSVRWPRRQQCVLLEAGQRRRHRCQCDDQNAADHPNRRGRHVVHDPASARSGRRPTPLRRRSRTRWM